MEAGVFISRRRGSVRRTIMNRTCSHRARDELQEGRIMLLTNTINTLTINTTITTGNVIVSVVGFRGCSACPAHVADRPSEKPAAKRLRERSVRRPGRPLHAMYSGDQMSWQQPWLDSPISQQTAPGLLLGLGVDRSLS